MEKAHPKYIIVGAGLSGLVTGYQLLKQGFRDFIILEARDRIGGRVFTEKQIDLGATWFQNHHTYLSQLLQDLSLDRFRQYDKGKSVLVYHSMAPAHFFESQHNGPPTFRISNGSYALVSKLAENMRGKIKLDSKVIRIHEKENRIIITTSKQIYRCDKCVITIPPKLASTLDFSPELPKKLTQVMKSTHTWMSNAIKVGILFSSPFWRNKELSGTIIGQVGPVIELYDHCNPEETIFALMGFVNEGLRDIPAEDRKERILSYLEAHLGNQVREHIGYFEKDWSLDRLTSCENLKSVYMSPRYGNPIYEDWYFNGKILFSGTETSPVHGGYLDGAIYSGIRATAQIKAEKL